MSSEQRDINRRVQEQRDGGDRRSVSPSSSTSSFDPARPEHRTGISAHSVGDSLPPYMQMAREISQDVMRRGTENSLLTGMMSLLEGSDDPRLHEDPSARRARLGRAQAEAQQASETTPKPQGSSNQAEASSSQPRKHDRTDPSGQERPSKKAREDLSSDKYEYIGRIGTLEQVQNITRTDMFTVTRNLEDGTIKRQLTDLTGMLEKRAATKIKIINSEAFVRQWDMKAKNADGDLEIAMRAIISSTNARLMPQINLSE